MSGALKRMRQALADAAFVVDDQYGLQHGGSPWTPCDAASSQRRRPVGAVAHTQLFLDISFGVAPTRVRRDDTLFPWRALPLRVQTQGAAQRAYGTWRTAASAAMP